MTRDLYAVITIPDDAVATAVAGFGESPGRWLHEGARRTLDTWHGEVRLGRLRRPISASVGGLWVDGPTRWRTLGWVPMREGPRGLQRDPLLPTFEGTLGLRCLPALPSLLLLQGTYDPPGGPVGSALDALVLHKAAGHTAKGLLIDILDRLLATSPPAIGHAAASHPAVDDSPPEYVRS